MDEYWAGVAQVIPVIALALVVEARAIAAGWSKKTRRIERAIPSLLLVSALGILATGESVAVLSLQGRELWSGWPSVVTFSIEFGMGFLVLTASMELLIRGNAELFASLFALHPILRLQAWYYIRRIAASMKEGDRLLDERRQVLEQAQKDFAGWVPMPRIAKEKLEELVAGGHLSPEDAALFEKLSGPKGEVETPIEWIARERQKLTAEKANHEVKRADFENRRSGQREWWKHASQRERKELTAYFAEFSLSQKRATQEQEVKEKEERAMQGRGTPEAGPAEGETRP